MLYTAIDGMAVVEAETWTSKQDSAQFSWQETTAADTTPVAQLHTRTASSPGTDATLGAIATAGYDIEVSAPNLYYLWVRARANNEAAITVDNSTVLTLALTPATENANWEITGFTDQWQWIAMDIDQNMLSANINTAGVYQLSLAADAPNLLVDKIVLTDQPGYAPTDTGPGATIVDTADTETGPTDDQATASDQTANNDTGASESNNGQAQQDDADQDESGQDESGQDESADTDNAANNSGENTEAVDTAADDTSPGDDDAQSSDTTTPEEDTGNVDSSMPPVVAIDGDNTIEAGKPLRLTASADSDPADGTLYYYWDQTLGNGVATIDNIKSRTPTVTFDLPGAYILQVTVANDAGYSNAAITITVSESTDNPSDTTDNDNSNSDNSTNDNANSDSGNDSGNGNGNEASSDNLSQQNIGSAHQWRSASARGSAAKRHETSGVAVNGKMYVIGGRGHQPVDVWDSATNTWSQAAKPPLEMHHFQAVAIDHIIYVVGAATCCYPVETNIANIYQFDTISGNWSKGAAIPGNRLRGSTAAAVYNRKIYIVGGNTRGHSGGAVNWFDEFDPATGQWRALADAPDARDHATIAVVGDQLVVAGGRQSNYPNTFGNTVARTNVYDFAQQRWQTAANIPTQRAGTMAVGLGSELVVIGGESLASSNAHNAVEAFDIYSRSWRRLNPLPTPRHGGAAAVIHQSIHVVAGSKQRGGAPETDAHEILK